MSITSNNILFHDFNFDSYIYINNNKIYKKKSLFIIKIKYTLILCQTKYNLYDSFIKHLIG